MCVFQKRRFCSANESIGGYTVCCRTISLKLFHPILPQKDAKILVFLKLGLGGVLNLGTVILCKVTAALT